MPKVNWTSAGNSSKCGCCGGCDLIFQSLTASLAHHGFSPYDCDGEGNSSETRYLSVTYSGLATSGCGEYKKHGEASRTYTIDPMTGYQCISGDSQPNFWCSPGLREADECSSTRRKWDCGTLTNAEKSLNCDQNEDSEGEPLRKTLTESLSQPYTLNGVESNVDSLLSQNPITDSSMPPGAAGTVVAGTGHSIISWGGGAATSAYFYKDYGLVMKTKLRVKFPTARTYKLITKDEDGNVVSEEEREATAGQVIDVPPPSSPGYTSVDPSCGFPSIGTSLECNVSGSYTTRRRIRRDAEGNELPPLPFCGFIGPDCKEYNYRTVTSTASGSYNSSGESGIGDVVFADWAVKGKSSYTTSTDAHTCPSISSCEGSRQLDSTFTYGERYEGGPMMDFEATEVITEDVDLCTGEGTCTREESDEFGSSGAEPYPCGTLGIDPTQAASCSTSCSGSSTETTGSATWMCEGYMETTQTTNLSVSTSGSSVNMSGSLESTETLKDCEYDTFNSTLSAQCNTVVSYSNSDGTEEGGSGPHSWESESVPWCSGEQTENCMTFSGCVERYKSSRFSTESTANVSCTAKFTAPTVPEGGDPKYFNTWFHYYTVEDSGPSGIETNLGAIGCRVRTVVAYDNQVGSTSSGGEVSLSGPSISLSTSDGKTKCLIGPIAYTYELPE